MTCIHFKWSSAGPRRGLRNNRELRYIGLRYIDSWLYYIDYCFLLPPPPLSLPPPFGAGYITWVRGHPTEEPISWRDESESDTELGEWCMTSFKFFFFFTDILAGAHFYSLIQYNLMEEEEMCCLSLFSFVYFLGWEKFTVKLHFFGITFFINSSSGMNLRKSVFTKVIVLCMPRNWTVGWKWRRANFWNYLYDSRNMVVYKYSSCAKICVFTAPTHEAEQFLHCTDFLKITYQWSAGLVLVILSRCFRFIMYILAKTRIEFYQLQ